MTHDEALIGTLAIIVAVIALAIGIGPWSQPYHLRSIAAVRRRFGKPIARGVWVAIAVAALTAGSAILNGMRPSYAIPAERTEPELGPSGK